MSDLPILAEVLWFLECLMVVKLLVKSVADPTYSQESVYPHACISIGRDESNLLVLPDEKRIISKDHAEIRTDDGRAEIVDLGSKNFTYLNGTRLSSHTPSTLADGDVLRLGDYEIEVLLQEVKAPTVEESEADDRTVFAFNPFWEDVGRLREVLTAIQKVYGREMPQRRREALFEAVKDAVEREMDEEVVEIVAAALSRGEAADPVASTFESSGDALDDLPFGTRASIRPEQARSPRKDRRQASLDHSARSHADPQPQAAAESDLEWLTSLLLSHASHLLGIPWRFRHEFIGQTIMQTDATAVLYEGDEAALREYLLDPSLSANEREQRFARVDEAADALRIHLIAVIDGYRATAREGIERFLDEIDLRVIEQQVAAQARWFEKPFARLRALKILVDRVENLRTEDWAVTERRVFRPAFIKSYLARMTSPPRS